MKKIDRQLLANSGQNVHAVGTFIWLKSATGLVSIKTDKGETALLGAGDFIRSDKRFDEFFVTDESGAQNDITFNISDRGEAGKYGSVSVSIPGSVVDTADKSIILATNTLILAANSNRHEAFITADIGNGAPSRVGTSNAGAARGQPLNAGDTIIITTTAAIYAYSAAAATFQLLETEF